MNIKEAYEQIVGQHWYHGVMEFIPLLQEITGGF